MHTALNYLGRVMVALLIALAVFGPRVLVAGDQAPGLRAAVAANFLIPMEKIVSLYRRETGIAIEVSAGSTGKLYAQIRHGAPYDLFLAADTERPRLLYNQGVAGKPIIYAAGEVRLWSGRKMKGTDWRDCLGSMTDKKIAIAGPDIAPYGKAARDGLRRAAIWEHIQGRLVYGQSVAQAFQFAVSGGAQAAFVSSSYALSDLGSKGDSRVVPEAGEVIQEACVILGSKQQLRAEHFLSFVTSEKTRTILQRYGYK